MRCLGRYIFRYLCTQHHPFVEERPPDLRKVVPYAGFAPRVPKEPIPHLRLGTIGVYYAQEVQLVPSWW